jgi:hypothetical protein
MGEGGMGEGGYGGGGYFTIRMVHFTRSIFYTRWGSMGPSQWNRKTTGG